MGILFTKKIPRVFTLLDKPRLSVFLAQIDCKQLIQKGAHAKCEDDLNIVKVLEESKLSLSNRKDGDLTLQSRVFQIKEFSLSEDSLCEVEIFSCEIASSDECVAILKKGEEWVEAPATLKGNHALFYAKDMDILYIISRPKCTRVTLTTKGLIIRPEVKNVVVEIPAEAVDRETTICLKVLTEQAGYRTGNKEVSEFDVYDLSPLIMLDHSGLEKFMRPVKVFLPLLETSVYTNTVVVHLHWTHDDEIELLEENIEIRNCVGILEVDSFLGHMIARVERGSTQNFESRKKHVKKQLKRRLGALTECQILIFVDTTEVNTLWVEVVPFEKVTDLLNIRKKDNPHLLEMINSRSPVISLKDGEHIQIDVEGKLRIWRFHKNQILIFRKTYMENHIRFSLERNPMGSSDPFSIISFIKRKKKLLHQYHFSEKALNVKEIAGQRIQEADVQSVGDGDVFSERSLSVLAKEIPITNATELGIELGLKANDIDHFRDEGHTGHNLTFRILQQWTKCNGTKYNSAGINTLSNALVDLRLQ